MDGRISIINKYETKLNSYSGEAASFFCIFQINLCYFCKINSIRHFLRLTLFPKLVYDKSRLAKEAEQNKGFSFGNWRRLEGSKTYMISPDLLLFNRIRPACDPDMPSIFSAQLPTERDPVINNNIGPSCFCDDMMSEWQSLSFT